MQRKLFAAAILFTCCALCGCAELDKSLFELANSFSSVDRLTGERAPNLTTRASQINNGDSAAQKLIDEDYKDKPVNEKLDAKMYDRIKTIFNRVHSVSHMRDEQWTVVLLPDETVNAFVMGGTHLFIHKGLVDEAKNDDEIAAVIGHEIAHVAGNHVYEKQVQRLVGLVEGAHAGQRPSFMTAFTHEDEHEADRFSILYTALAGYDPYAASELWARMYAKENDDSAQLVDHPIYSERLAATKDVARKVEQYRIKGKVNPDFTAILDDNVLARKDVLFGNLEPGKGGGIFALLTAIGKARMDYEKVRAEEERQKLRVEQIKQTYDYVEFDEFKPIDGQTFYVKPCNMAPFPLKDLTLAVLVNDETVEKRIDGELVPDKCARLRLEFATDLTTVDSDQIKYSIRHVEWVR